MPKQTLKNRFLLLAVISTFSTSFSSFAADAKDSNNAASEAETEEMFARGMSLRESGDYDGAIAAFQGILSSEPSLGRARAELAVAYMQVLNFAAARAEAESVIANPNTPDIVRLNMQYFLDEMNKQSKPSVFTPYITFGFGHDTNINAGPSTGTIDLGGGQIATLGSGASPISRNYNMLNVGLAHRYLSPTPINMLGRSGAYIWKSNVSYYRNNYLNDKDFDLNVLSVSTGPLAVVAERWRMGMDLSYDYVELGHSKLAEIYGVAPTASWTVRKNTDISLSTKFQKRDFNDSIAAGRDSDYQSANLDLSQTYYNSKLNLQLGAGFFNENADIKRFSNDGYQLSAGLNWKVAPNDSLYVKHVFKNSKFDGAEVIFNQARDENENRSTIGFNHRFIEKYVKDWTMDASINYIENDSNVEIFAYRRAQFALNFGKYF